MGQYYKIIILADNPDMEIIRMVIHPYTCKLMEHSYFENKTMEEVENLISPNGMFYMSRLVWAGDYAENEVDSDKNLYKIANNINFNVKITYNSTEEYRFIINHTKHMYVDKNKCIYNDIHPLPLLVSEGNGLGGGDYHGNNSELCGSWARDVISVNNEVPVGYIELECDFYE
jgi:hypothetical protein